ncbi:MAG TPA: nucleoside triphosphate pyrophosphatase [Allosphingosinicella sp.]|nr:nucleoside triphosphate pyrophosphatase [Allosphingosinicella sp.]
MLLASKSETRQRMLEDSGVVFETIAGDLDEELAKQGLLATGFEPRDLAEMLAELKANGAPAPGDALVLGADQTLETDHGDLLNKPGSREEAREQLLGLAGRSHYLHSAAVIVRDGQRLWGCTESVELRMRQLSEAFLDDYLDREYAHVRWNVGAYRIEGMGVQLFERIEGSHFAILGLPLLPLLAFLREQGVLQS